MIFEHLTDQVVLEPSLLYKVLFTDIAPTGPDQILKEGRVTRTVATIRSLTAAAAA